MTLTRSLSKNHEVTTRLGRWKLFEETGGFWPRFELLPRHHHGLAAVGRAHLALGVRALGGEQAGAAEVQERRQAIAGEAVHLLGKAHPASCVIRMTKATNCQRNRGKPKDV